MADSVNYQYFQTLLQAFENTYPEKDKNTAQVTVAKIWKKMKMDFSTANELDAEVKRQSNKWETLSFTKKTKRKRMEGGKVNRYAALQGGGGS